MVAGGGVSGDGEGLAGDLERDGALAGAGAGARAGAGGAVAGLAGAEKLFRVFYRDLDGPAARVALNDLGHSGVAVGGDQGDAEAAARLVADEDDGDGAGAEDGVPQAGDSGGRTACRRLPPFSPGANACAGTQ